MSLKDQIDKAQQHIAETPAYAMGATRKEVYEVPEGLMDLIYETLKWYGNECSYQGNRTGGVLQGCPRGPAPSPERLTLYARQALKRINKEVLGR